MKLTAILLSFLFLAPVAALAQQGPPPGPMSGGMHGDMRGNMKQMREAHEAFRRQVLTALTPANRQLLANVVGELAIADKPDPKAAAAKLDAALSSGEKQAILADAKQAMDKMKAERQQRMQAWQSAHPDATPRPKRSPRGERSPHTPDPGMILLIVSGHGEMMGGHHEHPRS